MNQHDSPHLGQILLKKQVGSITLTRIRYDPGARLPNHSHERACFALIQSGGYTEAFRSQRFCLQAGRVLFRPAGEHHCDEFAPTETACFLVEVASEWLDHISSYGQIRNEPLVSRGPQMAQLTVNLRLQIEHNDAAATLAIEGLSYALGAQLLRECLPGESSYPPRWLRRVFQQLSDDPCCKVELNSLALESGVHPGHLSRQFRRYYGENLWDFLRRRRIEIAAEQIAHSEKTLGEIALSSGYPDQSHFTRVFRQFMGLTPSEYRHSRRGPGVFV